MGVYQQWTQLTTAEQMFIASHPQFALFIKASKDTAFTETGNVFGANGHNDASDAFRHCFWSSILARDMGFTNAFAFTTAHESDPANPANEKVMDLHNNRVGLGIGSTFFTEANHITNSITPFSIGGTIGARLFSNSDADLSRMCQAALKAGQLQTAP